MAGTGLTLVLITHDASVARRAQAIGVMNKGHLTIHRAANPAPLLHHS